MLQPMNIKTPVLLAHEFLDSLKMQSAVSRHGRKLRAILGIQMIIKRGIGETRFLSLPFLVCVKGRHRRQGRLFVAWLHVASTALSVLFSFRNARLVAFGIGA